MKNKNEKFPRCPYCGAKMRHQRSLVCRRGEEDVDVMVMLHWYECTNEECEIESPARNTAERAYEAAMKRYEEPNRVLTLEEVREIAIGNDGYTDGDACWLEQKAWHGGEWASIHDRRVYEYSDDETRETFDWLVIGSENFDTIEASEYGKTWRCWLRHPTKQEMTETPWEEEKNA